MSLSKENLSRLPHSQTSWFKEGPKSTITVSSIRSNRTGTGSQVSAFKGAEWTSKAKENLRVAYNNFESGKLTKENFRNVVENDIGIKITPEFEKKIERVDCKFADVVRSLNANAPKSPSGIKSSVNPLTWNFHRYKKSDVSHDRPEKMTKGEKVVESIQGLLDGRIDEGKFLDVLRENNVDTKNIEKELNRFKSSHQGNFREFGVKIMKELKSQPEGFGVDAPHNTERDLLGTAKESLYLHQMHYDFNDEKLDAEKKRCQIRYVMTNDGKPIYCETKNTAPNSTRAKLTNGNIITWASEEKPTADGIIQDSEKPQGKLRSHVTHRDKQANIKPDFQYNPYSESSETVIAQRKKNMWLHTKDHNFIGW